MIQATKPLSKSEEKKLIMLAKKGNNLAMGRIVTSYLPIIRRYAKVWEDGYLDTEELAQVAMLSISHAVYKYDFKRGTRFISYANKWWRRAIKREAIQQLRGNLSGMKSINGGHGMKLLKVWRELPIEGDIVENFAKEAKVGRSVALGYIMSLKKMKSMDESYSEDGDPFVETVDSKHLTPEECFMCNEKEYIVNLCIDNLPERERNIIKWTFYKDMSYSEIGNLLGVSRQRVKQIYDRAMCKIGKELNYKVYV